MRKDSVLLRSLPFSPCVLPMLDGSAPPPPRDMKRRARAGLKEKRACRTVGMQVLLSHLHEELVRAIDIAYLGARLQQGCVCDRVGSRVTVLHEFKGLGATHGAG